MAESIAEAKEEELRVRLTEQIPAQEKTLMELSSKIPNRILQFIDGTVMVNNRFFEKIYEGQAFSLSKRFEGIAADASADMYFLNQSGSGKRVYVIMIEIISFAQGWIDIYRNATVSTAGTQINPVNLNTASTNTSVVHAEYGGTYSGGTLVHETVVPGGSRIRAVGGASEVGESVIIGEGDSILVRFTNKSASSTDMSIRIIWWEEEI